MYLSVISLTEVYLRLDEYSFKGNHHQSRSNIQKNLLDNHPRFTRHTNRLYDVIIS